MGFARLPLYPSLKKSTAMRSPNGCCVVVLMDLGHLLYGSWKPAPRLCDACSTPFRPGLPVEPPLLRDKLWKWEYSFITQCKWIAGDCVQEPAPVINLNTLRVDKNRFHGADICQVALRILYFRIFVNLLKSHGEWVCGPGWN